MPKNPANSPFKVGNALAKIGSSVLSAENAAAKAANSLVNTGNAGNALIKADSAAEAGFKFRKTFEIRKEKLNFYPPHMAHGMQKMQGRLGRVDCVLEVHDARIPFTGRNPTFHNKLTAIRPHILVLNKMDLVNHDEREEVREILLRNEPNLADVIYTNSKMEYSSSIKSIMPKISDAIERCAIHNLKKERYFMTIGVPNTGKSSIINAMRRYHVRKGKACAVADHAMVTRSVQERVKLLDNPLTYCIDTPGITAPSVPDVETGMRLAAVGCLQDANVGLDSIVDYLLYFMNKRGMFHYVNHFGLEEPTDDVYVLLINIARALDWTVSSRVFTSGGGKRKRYDTLKAATYFLDQFRKGQLGMFILDDDKLNEEREKHSTLRLPAGYRPLAIDSN